MRFQVLRTQFAKLSFHTKSSQFGIIAVGNVTEGKIIFDYRRRHLNLIPQSISDTKKQNSPPKIILFLDVISGAYTGCRERIDPDIRWLAE